ncbi:Dimer_Tnp_hAT domain-containing protein [Cephalotus follicularis]|uniref:Dimer_Tnp_hAT domain-containing protein n=1 Tax=Cephalotus follicularis TaxID=3775 RepID=A0A1Q3DA18_CEPFO|nr:Dimer_Tnp_hAT domain-containing protein [Cephalotus follicularis]
MRRFNKAWFDKYSTWLEYSITDDATYCLYFYLFNPSGKTFVNIGFNKDKVYPLVYMLLKLDLILPISTVTVERAFSTLTIIKNQLRNRMEDQWMNDILVTYIEKDIFNVIDNEAIIQRLPYIIVIMYDY